MPPQFLPMDITCIQNSIGLANCACPCQAANAPEGYNTSPSGLFVADLPGLGMLSGWESCEGQDNPWALLADARRIAAIQLASDIGVKLAENKAILRRNYTGWVGEQAANRALTLSKTYAGVRFELAPVKHGFVSLDKIGGVFSTVGTVALTLYDVEGQTLATANLTTIANRFASVSLTESVSLPTVDRFGNPAQYFLAYTVSGAPTPLAIRTSCGCGISVDTTFRLGRKYPAYIGKPGAAWVSWIMAGGFQADTLDFAELSQATTATSEVNGLALHITAECDVTQAVCSGEYDNNDPVNRVMANALMYLTGKITADKLRLSTTAQRSMVVNRSDLEELSKQWLTEYYTRIEWLGHNAKSDGGGCVECRKTITVNPILA